MTDQPTPGGEALRRHLRLLDVVALGVNGVIGTGIFLMPGRVAALLGPAALYCFLAAAVLCTLLALCFAEAGSRFQGTGGPMLYSRAAFGDVIGYGVGWITWVVRVVAWAALANALVDTADAVFPGAAGFRAPLICALFLILSGINIAGVRMGARVTNLFTVAKLVPIAVFILVGVFHIDGARFTPFAPHGIGSLADATLIILWAFVGFEVLTVPAGEMGEPKRSVPRALLSVMALVSVVYLAVWAVTTGTLATLAGSERPVSDAAAVFMGPAGGRMIAIGIFLSVLGINAGSALVAPRCLYALANERFLPDVFGRVLPSTGTPVVAIVVTGLIGLALALTGSFVELAVISVVARFAQYIPTCLAILVLRRGESPGFRTPGGAVIPLLAVALCVWLLIETEPYKLFWGLIAVISGMPLYRPAWIALRARITKPPV